VVELAELVMREQQDQIHQDLVVMVLLVQLRVHLLQEVVAVEVKVLITQIQVVEGQEAVELVEALQH
tara:strand:- start:113 stop:313 length:201 start_codon:yes stop_codon:yes gene_type:complete